MRFRLRTLLIVLTLMPPLLAWGWSAWQEALASARGQRERERAQMALCKIADDLMIQAQYIPVPVGPGPTADLDLPFNLSSFSSERTIFVPKFDSPASVSAPAP
jgi:hypothetical protein